MRKTIWGNEIILKKDKKIKTCEHVQNQKQFNRIYSFRIKNRERFKYYHKCCLYDASIFTKLLKAHIIEMKTGCCDTKVRSMF